MSRVVFAIFWLLFYVPATAFGAEGQEACSSVPSFISAINRYYYLLLPPRKPKWEIARYVESQGIPVPLRFESLEQAWESQKPFIIRSEHPDEYAGASGLLDSFKVWDHSLDLKAVRDYERRILNGKVRDPSFDFRPSRVDLYCTFLKLNPRRFKKKISVSYWQLLGGYNRVVIADSAIPSRYHIFTTNKDGYSNYTIFENGELVYETPKKLLPELASNIGDVILFYERIKRLSRFDPHHNPIVEFQTVEGKHYFLQYHRVRDFSPTTFTLSRSLEPGEVQADFVRGATSKEGIITYVVLYGTKPGVFDGYDAGYPNTNNIFDEILSRRRKIQFIENNLRMAALADYHLSKSLLFKPEISVIKKPTFIPKDILEKLERESTLDHPVVVPLRVISDGRKAYIKLMVR